MSDIGLIAPSRRRTRALLTSLLVVSALAPAVLLGAFVHVHGRNVPFWDEWDAPADVAIRASRGEFSLPALARQHNEHRLFFSYLTTAVVARTTHWNRRAEMFLSVALAAASLLLVVAILHRDSPRALPIALVPASLIVFSLRQNGSWLVGLQTAPFFLGLFVLLALFMLRRSPPQWGALVVAAACAAGATFAQGSGIVAWPTLLLALWLHGYRRSSFLVFWLGAAAVTLLAFFSGYRFSSSLPIAPGRWLRYALTFMGSPCVEETAGVTDLARLAAATGIGVFVADLRVLRSAGHSWRQLATWIALGSLSWGSALLAAPHRAHLGMRHALSSRYVTPASMFWLALVMVAGMAIVAVWNGEARIRWRRAITGFNLLVLVGLALVSIHVSSGRWGFAFVSEAHAECLRRYPVTRDHRCLRGLYDIFDPDPPDRRALEVLRKIDALREHHFAVFADGARGN